MNDTKKEEKRMNETTTKTQLKEYLVIHGPPVIASTMAVIIMYIGSLTTVEGLRLPLLITSSSLFFLSVVWDDLRELGANATKVMAGIPLSERFSKRPVSFMLKKFGYVPFLMIIGFAVVAVSPYQYTTPGWGLLACTCGIIMMLIGAVMYSVNRLMRKMRKMLDINQEVISRGE